MTQAPESQARECFTEAVKLHRAGRASEAIPHYRQAIGHNPAFVEAHNNCGIAHSMLGQVGEALACYDIVLQLRPDDADAWVNRGIAHSQLGSFDEAVVSFDRALALRPNHPVAAQNRAMALVASDSTNGRLAHPRDARGRAAMLVQQGITVLADQDIDGALRLFDQALALDPALASAHGNRGKALVAKAEFGAAIAALDRAIARDPAVAVYHYDRGAARLGSGAFAQARADFAAAIAIAGDITEFHLGHGRASERLGEIQVALASVARAGELSPSRADILVEQGRLLSIAGRMAAAVHCFDRAIALADDNPHAHLLRANSLEALHSYEAALASADKAIALSPRSARAHESRANVLTAMRHYEDAIESYTRVLEIEPGRKFCAGQQLHLMMRLCCWSKAAERLAAICGQIRAGEAVALPFTLLSLVDDPELHGICSSTYLEHSIANVAPALPPYPSHERIRVGYFSADFQAHATMFLIADMLEAHDRNRFEIVAFSYGPRKIDAWRERARAACDAFHDVQDLSADEIVRLARDLEIDIAVDLKGLTLDERMSIFAGRAAPVQATYLGYPGVLSAPFMDYVIADPVIIPEERRSDHREKLVALPPSYQPNCRTRTVAERPVKRADFGLPDTGFVYFCFNQTYKITPEIFHVWMQILSAVPGSVLWLWIDTAEARVNLRAEAQAQSVDPERLIFADQIAVEAHLNRLPLADLFLDTRPYGAHTTAADALYMNLPVLTCPGRSFASRVAASLLTALGLPELIADSLEEYRRVAIDLGNDPPSYSAIRDRLLASKTSTTLYDPAAMARNIETAFEAIHAHHQQGLAPDHIVIG
jgi:predicted O-linked N-acetylglucosamine transferase (SPINDLY family)